ncbi:hypothetical protein ACFUEN_29255 [Streptomyces griseorubiginosus]|uniref:hypothetical protein n=1 Tax=Streptomyces griseorubiginosus TaxID=67304 RepID=UPI0036335B97
MSPKKNTTLPSAPVLETCFVTGCGTAAGAPRPSRDMVRVAGSKDGAPAHWYCAVRCAPIARARADLRSITTRTRGGR